MKNHKFRHIVYALALIVLLAGIVPTAMAGGSHIETMAGIVMKLNHYPSNVEKNTLAGITHDKNATAGEKELAGALMRMQHQLGGPDAEKLRALAADAHAGKGERVLAEILLGIAHHPSDSDKHRLQTLIE